MSQEYTQIIESASAIAKLVGSFILNERKDFSTEKVEIKGRNDMVSYVDKTSEQMLIEGLSKLIPECAFLAEESTVAYKMDAEYTWIIDPLDGTTNFIHGLPVFSTSIGLLHHDQLVGGIVYEINRDELFSATLGQGAFLNGRPIHVTNTPTVLDSLICTGFPVQDFSHLDEYLAIIRDLVQHSHGLRRVGSAATDLAYVACGRYDAFFEYNLNPWDVAAGILLVKEAGGTVTDFSGESNALFGRQILAGGQNHQELLTVIKKHWRPSGAA